jgi:hypothetical protein
MVEIELSVLVRQCLGKRRLPDIETLRREVSTLGKRSATGWGWVSPGASPQPMRARSCVSSTHPLSLDGGVVRLLPLFEEILSEEILSLERHCLRWKIAGS